MSARFAALAPISLLVLLVLLSGCAAIQGSEAHSTERILAAAGFQMRMADTDEKIAHLKEFQQRKLIPQIKDGKQMYIYADADYCKCVYAGTEAAYQRYQSIAVQKQIADEQMMAADEEEDASMDWGMYGPWYGTWY